MLIVKSIDSSVLADSTIAQGQFLFGFYSGLNLNQYGVASPFVLSAASLPCPDLNLTHYNV